ncbi:carbon-nitrogen hydrolase family protein [Rhodoferax sp.]|uniref:carbon-nitrogen hydrolase family protein n=1 Tax=Rhodoferax sp. TaxID=50421 RepID=UPI0025CF9286|nr:carbon-nitrogen hydrolase family protein [Rhodoferax sp.]
MHSLRIAAAQSISVPGDISANVRIHTQFIAAAQHAGVDLLVFPELSLSGYEPALLPGCVLHPGDARLTPLQNLARQARMAIVVGAPIAAPDALRPYIGAISFFPDGSHSVYCKKHLHASEESFATPGDPAGDNHFAVHGTPLALAICADAMHAPHAERAAAAGASLYIASSVVSVGGYAAEVAQLRQHTRQFGMGVLMANQGGTTGGYVCAGQSGFWAPGGDLVVAAPGTGPVLVVAEYGAQGWSGAVHAVALPP